MKQGHNFRGKINGHLIHKDGFNEEITRANMIQSTVPWGCNTHSDVLHCNEDTAVSETVQAPPPPPKKKQKLQKVQNAILYTVPTPAL
jgi:hypothetical protein